VDTEPQAPERSVSELALFPLNAVLFPGGPLPLRIFEPRYVDMVRRCMREQCAFGVVLILEGAEAAGPVKRMASVGTSARIADFYPMPDGLLGIFCLGERKFRVLRHWSQENGLLVAEVQYLPAEPAVPLPDEYRHLGLLMTRLLPELGELYESVERHAEDAAWVSLRLAEILPVSAADKQRWLELEDPLARLAELEPLIRRE
jgi:uncharacterized protein